MIIIYDVSMRMDFTGSQLSNVIYGGSEKKTGIIFANQKWMLKYRKKTIYGDAFNDVSEYLGSKIFALLGFQTQEVLLGTYNGQYVVACKDFISNNQFTPFNDVGESTIDEDKEKYQYSYEDIMKLLMANKKLTNVEETISSFFDIYVVDALLGNFDRHGANWGFLKKNNKYILAPIFDNGSCLYPNLTNEDEMQIILNTEEEINNRIYKFPTSQIKLDGHKSSYYEVISSLKYKEVNEALLRIYPRIDLDKIYKLIDDISIISDIHKTFYKTMIKYRYEKIIKYSYERLKGILWEAMNQKE